MPKPLFTRENAAEYARRSVAARLRNRQAKLEQEQREREEQDRALATPLPDSDYLTGRLACVRVQLARIDQMLLSESDPQRMDRLAAASAKLSEVERQLAGRPAPGAYRPSAPRRRTEQAVLIPE